MSILIDFLLIVLGEKIIIGIVFCGYATKDNSKKVCERGERKKSPKDRRLLLNGLGTGFG
jgi:hypothetical protein